VMLRYLITKSQRQQSKERQQINSQHFIKDIFIFILPTAML
jgi:hypothetical protein